MNEAKPFFEFVNERERIRILKESGVKAPWTDYPILREFRFCNVFREDDRTTRFFRDTVREPLRNEPEVVIATIGWRWFNRIETCARVPQYSWAMADTEDMRAALRECKPLVTGAYIIKTPNGMSKLEGILDCIEVAESNVAPIISMHEKGVELTLEDVHEYLMRLPYLGRFMAYEIVTDLRHTYLGENAPDIMTWANAGPGAIRGLGWVLESNPGLMSYGPKKSQEAACELMQKLLDMSRYEWAWPDRPWEMREVEHCLCEYDKYRRAQGGQRLKRRYQS